MSDPKDINSQTGQPDDAVIPTPSESIPNSAIPESDDGRPKTLWQAFERAGQTVKPSPTDKSLDDIKKADELKHVPEKVRKKAEGPLQRRAVLQKEKESFDPTVYTQANKAKADQTSQKPTTVKGAEKALDQAETEAKAAKDEWQTVTDLLQTADAQSGRLPKKQYYKARLASQNVAEIAKLTENFADAYDARKAAQTKVADITKAQTQWQAVYENITNTTLALTENDKNVLLNQNMSQPNQAKIRFSNLANIKQRLIITNLSDKDAITETDKLGAKSRVIDAITANYPIEITKAQSALNDTQQSLQKARAALQAKKNEIQQKSTTAADAIKPAKDAKTETVTTLKKYETAQASVNAAESAYAKAKRQELRAEHKPSQAAPSDPGFVDKYITHRNDDALQKIYRKIDEKKSIKKKAEAASTKATNEHKKWAGIKERFANFQETDADKKTLQKNKFLTIKGENIVYLDENENPDFETKTSGKDTTKPRDRVNERINKHVKTLEDNKAAATTDLATAEQELTEVESEHKQHYVAALETARTEASQQYDALIQTYKNLPRGDEYAGIATALKQFDIESQSILADQPLAQLMLADKSTRFFAEFSSAKEFEALSKSNTLLPRDGSITPEGKIATETLSNTERELAKQIKDCKQQLKDGKQKIAQLEILLNALDGEFKELEKYNNENGGTFRDPAGVKAAKTTLTTLRDERNVLLEEAKNQHKALEQSLQDVIARIDREEKAFDNTPGHWIPRPWNLSAVTTLTQDSEWKHRNLRSLEQNESEPLPNNKHNRTEVYVKSVEDPESGQPVKYLSTKLDFMARNFIGSKREAVYAFWGQCMVNGALQTDDKGKRFIKMTEVHDNEARAILKALGEVYGVEVRGKVMEIPDQREQAGHKACCEREVAELKNQIGVYRKEQEASGHTFKDGSEVASGFRRHFLTTKGGVPESVYIEKADDILQQQAKQGSGAIGVQPGQQPAPSPQPTPPNPNPHPGSIGPQQQSASNATNSVQQQAPAQGSIGTNPAKQNNASSMPAPTAHRSSPRVVTPSQARTHILQRNAHKHHHQATRSPVSPFWNNQRSGQPAFPTVQPQPPTAQPTPPATATTVTTVTTPVLGK